MAWIRLLWLPHEPHLDRAAMQHLLPGTLLTAWVCSSKGGFDMSWAGPLNLGTHPLSAPHGQSLGPDTCKDMPQVALTRAQRDRVDAC